MWADRRRRDYAPENHFMALELMHYSIKDPTTYSQCRGLIFQQWPFSIYYYYCYYVPVCILVLVFAGGCRVRGGSHIHHWIVHSAIYCKFSHREKHIDLRCRYFIDYIYRWITLWMRDLANMLTYIYTIFYAIFINYTYYYKII